jgi:hypothetical protein
VADSATSDSLKIGAVHQKIGTVYQKTVPFIKKSVLKSDSATSNFFHSVEFLNTREAGLKTIPEPQKKREKG